MKKFIKIMCFLLIGVMALSMIPVSAFATVDFNGNEIIDRRQEVYVAPGRPIDSTLVGLERPMPRGTIMALTELPKDFEEEVSDPKAGLPEDYVELPVANFGAKYDITLDQKKDANSVFYIEGELPYGIAFDAENGRLSGTAYANQAGQYFSFKVSGIEDVNYVLYVPMKEIDNIVITGVAEPKSREEASYGGAAVFMCGKAKMLGDQDSLDLNWYEYIDRTPQQFDVYNSGHDYLLDARLRMPVGYRISNNAVISINGSETRFVVNNTGSRAVAYLIYHNIGAKQDPFFVTYIYDTQEPEANLVAPRTMQMIKAVAPYNYAPIPPEPIEQNMLFGGWYTDEARTLPYDFDSVVNHNLTLFAKWITVIDSVEINTSNLYQSESKVYPSVELGYKAKYFVSDMDWVVAPDLKDVENDILYESNLMEGETYILRLAIKPSYNWGVFRDGITSIDAQVNGVLIPNKFNAAHDTVYVYAPITILPTLHEHALSHYKEVAPTCDKDGTKEYWKCKKCSLFYLDDTATMSVAESSLVIPALGHNFGDWTVKKEATCKSEGQEIRVCQNDNRHTETRTTDKLDHKWGAWEVKKEATDTSDGQQKRVCSLCNATDSQYIPAKNHVHKMKLVEGTPATCEHKGALDYYLCSRCNKKFADEAGNNEIDAITIKPTGHNWGEWSTIKKATKYEEGLQVRVCLNDETHLDYQNIPKISMDTPEVYTVAKSISVDWQQSDRSTISFTANMESGKFKGVEIDGKTIESGNYISRTVTGNFVEVAFTVSYLNLLSEGEHEVKLVASDGAGISSINVNGKIPS